MAALSVAGSRSQIATTLTPGTFSMCRSRNEPRLPTPMKATRTESFGDCAESKAAPLRAAGVERKRRRVKFVVCILSQYSPGFASTHIGMPPACARFVAAHKTAHGFARAGDLH